MNVVGAGAAPTAGALPIDVSLVPSPSLSNETSAWFSIVVPAVPALTVAVTVTDAIPPLAASAPFHVTVLVATSATAVPLVAVADTSDNPAGRKSVNSSPAASATSAVLGLVRSIWYSTSPPSIICPDTVFTALGAGTSVVMITVKSRMLPMSAEKKSCTESVQVPFGDSPSNADNGAFGVNVPVKGAWAVTTPWIDPAPASSSSSVWQRLLPPPSISLITVTVVPLGDVSRTWRSLMKVWSMPTAVAPAVAVHADPPISRLTSVTTPVRPVALTDAPTVAPGLLPVRSPPSGIATGPPP